MCLFHAFVFETEMTASMHPRLECDTGMRPNWCVVKACEPGERDVTMFDRDEYSALNVFCKESL